MPPPLPGCTSGCALVSRLGGGWQPHNSHNQRALPCILPRWVASALRPLVPTDPLRWSRLIVADHEWGPFHGGRMTSLARAALCCACEPTAACSDKHAGGASAFGGEDFAAGIAVTPVGGFYLFGSMS